MIRHVKANSYLLKSFSNLYPMHFWSELTLKEYLNELFLKGIYLANAPSCIKQRRRYAAALLFSSSFKLNDKYRLIVTSYYSSIVSLETFTNDFQLGKSANELER